MNFSKELHSYLEKSYNKNYQEKHLEEENNKIIKENIAKLENCIKKNLNKDNTQPFDKTFICNDFKKLKLNNNNDINKDYNDNLFQFINPMKKINLNPTNITTDFNFVPNYMGKNNCGDYIFKSDIIPKNTFTWLNNNLDSLVIRISNHDNIIGMNEYIYYPINWK